MERAKTHYFENSTKAWKFMRRVEAQGHIAGFPSLRPDQDGYYTVQVLYREKTT